MVLNTVLHQVSVLFLLMLAGYLCSRLGLLKKAGVKDITGIIFNLISPCVILVSFQIRFTQSLARELVLSATVGIAVHLVCAAGAQLLFKHVPEEGGRRAALKMGTVYTNAGAMGFPLLDAVIGSEGIFFGSVFFAIYNIFSWTHGVSLYTGKTDKKSILRAVVNPNVIAIAVGILLFCLNVKLPALMYDAMHDIYNLNMPLSMVIIGVSLAQVDLKTLVADKWIWPGIFLRNLAIPFILAVILHFCGIHGNMMMACVLPVCCPVAGITVLFSEQFGRDTGFAAKLMSVSTLLSIVTIPLTVSFLAFLK